MTRVISDSCHAVCGAFAALGVLALGAGCTSNVDGGGGDGYAVSTSDGATSGSGGSGGGQGSTTGGVTGNSTSAGDGTDGSAGGSGGDPVDRGSVTFECDPEVAPSVTPLRRLTRLQYENTLRDLFQAVPDAFPAAAADLEQLPPDGENDSVYLGNDTRVTQRHVDSYLGVADSIARAVTSDAAALVALAGDCAAESSLSSDCLEAFVSDFGVRVFRRPLSDEEVARYLELYDSATPGAEVFRGVLIQMLLAPQFLYQFEVDGTPGDDESRLALGPYEVASRLSFHFWATMPDAELFAAAADGSLLSDDGFEAQVNRLFEDDRTQVTLERFWHQWYQLDAFAGFASTPAFEAFAEGSGADDELYEAMLDELDQLVYHYTFVTSGTYRDVLSSNLVFTTSDRLAALYGVDAWDGTSDPPRFSDTERSGLLTRAALLVEGNELTNPIKRGAFVLKSILCEDLHPPSDLPAEALALPPADPDMSTRERFELKTSPRECSGCHGLINPYGFVLESFDALGRFRTEEHIYDDSGELSNTVPIDPAVDVTIGTTTFPVTNPVEFNARLAESAEVDDCFARQYFRFSYRRDESTGDSCTLAAIRDGVAPGGSLKQALRDVALAPSFRERVIGEP